MQVRGRIAFFAVLLAFTIASNNSNAQDVSAIASLRGGVSSDPLRSFLPRNDLFMQVPGGQLAVGGVDAEADTVERQKDHRHGGFIVGYCLRLSCTRVTHLAVLQVCHSRVGGVSGDRELILGVVKLPYGDTLGYLKALQGRNYAANYSRLGPFEQILTDKDAESVSSNYTILTEGMGPVAPLEFVGLSPKRRQSPMTRSLQLNIVRDGRSGAQIPRFEVRHLCEWQFG